MLYEIDGQSPEIHESAFVASSADIMGSVIVRAKASVWFNVVIRGDCDLIEVGEGDGDGVAKGLGVVRLGFEDLAHVQAVRQRLHVLDHPRSPTKEVESHRA